MGLLKYTKDYSASDDGSTIKGADVGTLQADIAAVINGGLTNINIAASAGIAESKLTFDTTTGHNHDGSNSTVLSSGGQRGYIQGAELEWVATDQVKAQSGTIEIAGTFYTRLSYSTTIDLDTATHWVEGASQRGTSKWVYVYAYNDSSTTWDIKYWLQAPQYANTGTDDSSVKIYRQDASVWYRCIGAVRLNATGSGEIVVFYQNNDVITYDDRYDIFKVLTAGAEVAFTDVNCSSSVPVISKMCSFVTDSSGASILYWRMDGSAAIVGVYGSIAANGVSFTPYFILSSAQVGEYKVSANNVTLWVISYIINIR